LNIPIKLLFLFLEAFPFAQNYTILILEHVFHT